MQAWCRACGQPVTAQHGPCASCGVDLAISPPPESPVGLAFEMRGKLGLGTKRGICIGVEGESLLLHLSAKDKEATRVPAGTAPADLVPPGYSAATRLLYAADLPDTKLAWDRDLLRARAAELCSDVRVLRRVVDEALVLGWAHIVDWVPLTDSETVWRRAHHAAATSDETALREAVAALPSTGYAARGELLLGHLALVRRNAAAWRPVLAGMVTAEVPHAVELLDAATGEWSQSLSGGTVFLAEDRRRAWMSTREQLASGTAITASSAPHTTAWAAASMISSPDARSLDGALAGLAGLEPALLDDLIESGRLTAAARPASLSGAVRTYLLARLDPSVLTDEEVRRTGHDGELARRLFLSRDKATLSGLDDSPRVRHFQALLDVIEGARPDPDRLDAQTIALLDLPTSVLADIKDGVTQVLPPAVIADPSLWPMFGDLAINGKLLPASTLAADHPLNVWIGLHRMLGLLWESRFADAVEHGELLVRHLHGMELQEDEVLNLTAFALDQTGRVDDALRILEKALQGLYTENLLVNVSIIAAKASPEVGVRHLARLVDEAPTPELQRAGLDQAINVWQRTELDFPPVLVPALRTVLGTPAPISEYLRLGIVGVNVAPQVVQGLPNLGGELDGPFRLLQIRARWKTDDNFLLGGLAEAYAGLYKSVGRVDWFMDDWSGWVGFNRDAIFVDFGDAMGSAAFVDAVLINAPDMFTDEERFILAPQAGAHFNASFAQRQGWLNDQALSKFFFRPIDDFSRTRGSIAAGLADYLAENFTLCLGNVGINMIGAGRDSVAGEYNPLNERMRWDAQNRYALRSQMERILVDTEHGVLSTLDTIVDRMRRLASSEKAELTRLLANDVAEWRDEITRLRRNL